MLSFEFFRYFILSKRAGSLVKTISRISILGIWLGVASLVVVISVMNGFNRSIRDRLLEVEPHIVVDFDNVTSTKQVEQHAVFRELQGDRVSFVAPMSHQDVILRTADGFVQGAIANGVTRERLLQLLEFAEKKAGKKDSELKEKIQGLKAGQIILGVGLADKTGLFRDDNVVIVPPETMFMPASEIPILSQGNVQGFLLTDVDRIDGQSFYYILEKSFPRLQKTLGRRIALEVWLKDPDTVDLFKESIMQEGISVETWKERNASLFFALKIEKFVVSFLVALSTLIAGLSIISVMVLLLTQKKKDVGNLLAMGMTRKKTKNLFVKIGLYLTLTGVLGGMVTGVILSLCIDAFSKDVLPAFYEETNIPTEIQFFQVASIVVIGVLASYFALNITMNKLSSFKPSEILRG